MTFSSPDDRPRRSAVSFSAWGHPAIRATHRGSLEITLDADVTPRATCVIGVGARVDTGDLAGFLGPVEIVLRSGPYQQAIRATAHAGFRLRRSIVVRRSQHLSPDTFAVGADVDARELSRELADHMRDPAARLVIAVRGLRRPEAASGGTLVLMAGPGDDRAGSLDLLIADRRGTQPDVREAVAALRAGGRVGLLLHGEIVLGRLARQVALAAVELGMTIDSAGVPVEPAALLLAGFDADLPVWLGRIARPRAVRDGELDGVIERSICVCCVPSASLDGLLAEVEHRYGQVPTCLFCDARAPGDAVLRGTTATVRQQLGGRTRRSGQSVVVFAPPPAAVEPAARGASEGRLLRALLDEGVPDRTVMRAASTALGWGRREAYAAIQRLKRP